MKKGYIFTFFFGVFILICILIWICALMEDRVDTSDKKYDLQRDGVIVIKNVFDDPDIQYLKTKCTENNYYEVKRFLIENPHLKKVVQETTTAEYEFQDYIWIIQKSSVHTCHRDNNGDFFNEGQKYPSYTMLVYLEDMEKCLGVIPTSHADVNSFNVNFTNSVTHLVCNKGDIILFNANLIHVGALNMKPDNMRVQMKVTHRDDREVISYYEDFNKVLNKDNNIPFFMKKIQKNASCMFPAISNLTQGENIRSARGSDNGASIGLFQKMFSYTFYGNSDFYDLPNAFSKGA